VDPSFVAAVVWSIGLLVGLGFASATFRGLMARLSVVLLLAYVNAWAGCEDSAQTKIRVVGTVSYDAPDWMGYGSRKQFRVGTGSHCSGMTVGAEYWQGSEGAKAVSVEFVVTAGQTYNLRYWFNTWDACDGSGSQPLATVTAVSGKTVIVDFGSKSADGGGAFISDLGGVDCGVPCVNGTWTNSVPAEGWIYSYAPAGGKPAYVYTWLTRSNCVSGSWVVVSNDVFNVSGNAYLVLTACPSGEWQTRQRVSGMSVVSGKVNWTFDPVESNSKSCAQLAAEAAGLVWTNLTAGQQAALAAGIPAASLASGSLVLDPGDGTNYFWQMIGGLSNSLPAFGLTSSGLVAVTSIGTNGNGTLIAASGTGQGTGTVGNVVASAGSVNIANLGDLSRAVSDALDGGGSSSGLTGSVSSSSWSTSGWDAVTSQVTTGRFSSTFSGWGNLTSSNQASFVGFGSVAMGSSNIALGVDLGNNPTMANGLRFFRFCVLLGVMVGAWWAAMRIIREGVA
jgi:hypothetical protein